MRFSQLDEGRCLLVDFASSTEVEHGDTDDTDLSLALCLIGTNKLTFLSDLDWPEGVIPVVYSPCNQLCSARGGGAYGTHKADRDRSRFVGHFVQARSDERRRRRFGEV